jgi:hypothetical protein
VPRKITTVKVEQLKLQTREPDKNAISFTVTTGMYVVPY